MKDERLVVLKNQIKMEAYLEKIIPNPKPHKPFRVMTTCGDYFFETQEQAQAFADSRSGFVVLPTTRIGRNSKIPKLREGFT